MNHTHNCGISLRSVEYLVGAKDCSVARRCERYEAMSVKAARRTRNTSKTPKLSHTTG
jgi:hypothetical protein